MKKILSFLALSLSGVMLSCSTSFTRAQDKNYPDIIIPYMNMAQGQVDRKSYSVCEKTSDREKGDIYKVTANPDSAENGTVIVDAWSLDKYKVDLNKYNTLRVEYKYTSNSTALYTPYISISGYNGKTLKNWKSTSATAPLVKDNWAVAEFDLAKITDNNLGTDGILWQMHFAPFGNVLCKSLVSGETILLGNAIFSVDEAKLAEEKLPESVKISYTYGKAQLPDPATITAKPGDVITLPAPDIEYEGRKLTKWFCDNDTKFYTPGTSYTVPGEDVEFMAYMENVNADVEPIKINYTDYTGGIMNRVDTGTSEIVTYDGKKAVKVVPNPASENGAPIILDGWTYSSAKIHAEKYNTAIMIYKYISDSPVSGKAKINVLKWNEFSNTTSMIAREDIVEGKWAAASFDMSAVKNKAIEGKLPYLGQLHIYPLGDNKVGTLKSTDEIYVADLIFLPESASAAAYNASFIDGYDDGTFKPSGYMTRAQACTVIARIMANGDALVPSDTETSFSDVKKDAWYSKYISFCEKAGLLGSYSDIFEPDKNITRAEFVELVFKMGLLRDSGKNDKFTDVPADHTKAQMISAAGRSGLVNGYANGDGTYSFRPDTTITRAEVVTVLNNALGRYADTDTIKESGCKNVFSDLSEEFWGYAGILGAANTHIAYKDASGKERWVPMDKVIDESGFMPDYQAAINKAAEVDALMVKRIEEIRNTPDTLEPSNGGKKIYISNSGSDTNSGLSESTPVATVEAAQNIAKAGDVILFERGGEWRVNFTTVAGVSYGAYGIGAKPLINGNTTGDAANPALWTLVPGTTNIYTYRDKLRDVGNIIYNGGVLYTEKLVPGINEALELTVNNIKYNPVTSHTKNNTFFMVYDNITSRTLNIPSTYGTLYLRCDEGNPGEVYDSIEIASYGHAIIAKSDNTFENLCIMYAGGHGITAGTCKNLVIRDCEIGWIGGTSQYINNGRNTRYGNGIQIYGGSDVFVIDNCYVYECYDAGISPQYSAVGTNEILLKKIYYTNNVIDKCIYNIEYFMGAVESGSADRYFETMHYTGNILARSGYGWGMLPSRSACIKGWDHYNKASDFIIKDNIILNPAYNAYHISADFEGWLPELSGNTYIIRRNSQFVKYGANGSSQYTYDSTAEQTAKNVLDEKDFKLYYLPEDYVG